MNGENAVAVVEKPEQDKEVLSIVEVAKSLTITNHDEYLFVDQFLVKTSALKKRIVGRWEKAKKAAKAAHAAICDSENSELGLAEEAYDIAKKLKIVYEGEQEKIRAAEEARLNKIAQEKAEALAKEEARLQKIEDDRLAAERQVEIDRAAKLAADAAAKAEREGNARAAQKILDDAAAAETKARHLAEAAAQKARQDAEAAARRPVYVAPVDLAKDLPKAQTTSQTRWSANVTDPMFVLKAVTAAISLMAKAKTPAGIKAHADLVQAQEDLGFMAYSSVALSGQAKAGSPYVNGVRRLGGVSFNSRRV